MPLTTKNASGLIAKKDGQPMATRKVEILRNTFIKGKLAEPGDIVEVGDKDEPLRFMEANSMIHHKKARWVDDAKKAAPKTVKAEVKEEVKAGGKPKK